MTLATEKIQKITVRNTNKSGAKKNFELFMTLHRNESTLSGTRHMCMTQTLQNIEAEKKQFYTFIQTDKPIYIPGDTVRFRVVVVDRDLKPYHMNNIKINVVDSLNHTIKEFNDLGENFIGVFTGNFNLSTNVSVGIWKIRVVIDLLQQWETYKEFAVQKLTLPPFALHLTAKKHLFPSSTLKLSYFAKNQGGDFVTGNAELMIKCLKTGQIVISQLFPNVTGIQNANFKAQDDLKATSGEKLDYEVTLTFTEPESGIKLSETLTFTVHPNWEPKIRVNYPEKIIPGLPFHLKAYVYDWKDSLITKSVEAVKIDYKISLYNGLIQELSFEEQINDGIAENSFILSSDADEMTVKISYVNVVHKKKIGRGVLLTGINKLTVDHLPKK